MNNSPAQIGKVDGCESVPIILSVTNSTESLIHRVYSKLHQGIGESGQPVITGL